MKLAKETFYSKIIHILLFAMFAALFLVGICKSGVNLSIYDEHICWCNMAPHKLIWGLFLFCLGFGILGFLYDRWLHKVKSFIWVIIFAIITYGLAVLWIFSAQALPQSDAKVLILAARAINAGQIDTFLQDDYLVCFPYQLGFVTFIRVIMKLFGEDNDPALMMAVALSLPTIVAAGSGVISRILGKEKAGKPVFFFGILCVLCLPLYFYSCFIYGDLPFAALSLVCIWLVLVCMDKPSVISFTGFFTACALNYMLRTNALIVDAALVIYLVINLFKRNERIRSLILIGLAGFSVVFVTLFNNALYSRYIPEEYDSIPMLATVTMGLNDDDGHAGWCNFYHQITFFECEFDSDATTDRARYDFRERVKELIKDPVQGVDFFYRKINYQWNSPMFQSLAMINSHEAEGQPALGVKVYEDDEFQWKLYYFMKYYQIFVYGAVLVSLWLTRKEEKPLKTYLPGIAVFGSFIFSIIWEAKSRYVFPAFVWVILMAAVSAVYIQERLKEGVTVSLSERLKREPASVGNFGAIDLSKLIMAVCVVAIHTCPLVHVENEMITRAYSAFVDCAVPFFFLASGFFLGRKMSICEDGAQRTAVMKGSLKKMLKLYIIWSVIYLPLAIWDYVHSGFTIGYSLKTYFINLFFQGDHYNSWILWYILSAIYGLLVMWLLVKKDCKDRTVLCVAIGFLVLSLILDGSALYGDSTVFFKVVNRVREASFGNGRVFRGAFYIPVGTLLVTEKARPRDGILIMISGYLLSLTGMFDQVSLAVTALGIFILAREIKLPDNKIWRMCRNISTGTYFIHMWVWTILYRLIYGQKTMGPVMFAMTALVSVTVSLAFYMIWGRVKAQRNKE